MVIDLEQKDNKEIEIPENLPVLPVRDIVVFPYRILPLFVGREMSIKAIEHSLNSNKMVFMVTQKDLDVENPTPDDLYSVGTAGVIMRMLKLPDGRVKILIRGLSKARALNYSQTEPFFKANIEKIGELKTEQAQEILEIMEPFQRLKRVSEILGREIELLTVQQKIQSEARGEIDKTQREYYLREQLKAIQKELGDIDERAEEIKEFKKKIEDAKMPEKVLKEAEKQLKRLEKMHPDSAEAGTVRTYLDWLLEVAGAT